MSDQPAPKIDRFARRQPWKYRGLHANGRKLCFCGCGQPVGPRRSSSAGPECVKRWKNHSDANHIKFVLKHRDRGVCAICATDTVALQNEWRRALQSLGDEKHKGYGAEYQRMWPVDADWVLRCCWDDPKFPPPPKGFPKNFYRWWEADHIVPVVEGGGGCGPEGYRTLCIPCHRKETAALAGRRAARRKAAVPQLELL